MSARDPHRFINELDDEKVQRLIDRLESRGKDEVFTRLFGAYADRLDLPHRKHVVEVGCGTGVVVRALARRQDFPGKATGVDHSLAFIEAGRRLAAEEGLAGRVELRVGDAHELDFDDGHFDVGIVHTVISHVTDPLAVLREVSRVVRRGGAVAIFDGDYASLTYAHEDHEAGRAMDQALARATFNNPLIMRELPERFSSVGLELTDTVPNVVSEIGSASYFRSFAETYAPLVADAGLLPKDFVDSWLAYQHQAMDKGCFFASCNYYAYIARRR